jgi:murein DD-endopeptidase MepM/ murein hydrolase activator NlpD
VAHPEPRPGGVELTQDRPALPEEDLVRTLTVSEIMDMQGVKRRLAYAALRPQTLADHSVAVALLALLIGGEDLSLEDKFQALLLGLQNDAHEPGLGTHSDSIRTALLALGVDLEAECRARFWGADGPTTGVSPLVRDLVAIAGKVEAALFSRRFAPDIAGVAADEAQTMVSGRLSAEPFQGMRSRAMEMLG